MQQNQLQEVFALHGWIRLWAPLLVAAFALEPLASAAPCARDGGAQRAAPADPAAVATVASQAAAPRALRIVIAGSDPADGRVEAAREAVKHWNGVFDELKLKPPFGTVEFVQKEIPEELLARYSRAVLERGRYPRPEQSLLELPGDIVIALSNSPIVSFTAPLGRSGRRLIGVRTDRSPPLSLPNVSRNLLAHELGHVLGLRHNADPTRLMCGRPAPCRPGDFRSDEPKFFDLTADERERLVKIHGAGGPGSKVPPGHERPPAGQTSEIPPASKG